MQQTEKRKKGISEAHQVKIDLLFSELEKLSNINEDFSFYIKASESPLDLVKILISEYVDDCTTTLDMSVLPDDKNPKTFDSLRDGFKIKYNEKLRAEAEFFPGAFADGRKRLGRKDLSWKY